MTEKRTKKSKQKKKKILKLVRRTPSEDDEWVARQIKKLRNADKILIISIDDESVFTSWNNCSRMDIIGMCETLKHEILMEQYVQL